MAKKFWGTPPDLFPNHQTTLFLDTESGKKFWASNEIILENSAAGPETVIVSKAVWNWSDKDFNVNAASRIEPTKAEWNWDAKALNVNAATEIVVNKDVWNWNAKDVTEKADTLIAPLKAIWNWDGKNLSANSGVSVVIPKAVWTWAAENVTTRTDFIEVIAKAIWYWNRKPLSYTRMSRSTLIAELTRSLSQPLYKSLFRKPSEE